MSSAEGVLGKRGDQAPRVHPAAPCHLVSPLGSQRRCAPGRLPLRAVHVSESKLLKSGKHLLGRSVHRLSVPPGSTVPGCQSGPSPSLWPSAGLPRAPVCARTTATPQIAARIRPVRMRHGLGPRQVLSKRRLCPLGTVFHVSASQAFRSC